MVVFTVNEGSKISSGGIFFFPPEGVVTASGLFFHKVARKFGGFRGYALKLITLIGAFVEQNLHREFLHFRLVLGGEAGDV